MFGIKLLIISQSRGYFFKMANIIFITFIYELLIGVISIVPSFLAVSSSNQWIRFETKCFQINSEQMNRSMAIQTCQQRGAVLTSISNQSEWDFLSQTVNSNEPYWVWVSRKNGSKYRL